MPMDKSIKNKVRTTGWQLYELQRKLVIVVLLCIALVYSEWHSTSTGLSKRKQSNTHLKCIGKSFLLLCKLFSAEIDTNCNCFYTEVRKTDVFTDVYAGKWFFFIFFIFANKKFWEMNGWLIFIKVKSIIWL